MQDLLKIVLLIVVVHAAVLAAVILVIRKLLLSHTLRAVDRINQVEADVRKKEEGLRKEIEEREKELEQKRAEAEEVLQRRKEEMSAELSQLKEKMTAEARKESDRILDLARRNEEKLRQQVTLEAEQRAVEYGAQMMNMVFSEQLTSALDKHFVDELLDALEGLDASTITIDGTQAEFTTSHSLPPEQKERLKKILADKFGVEISVEEKIQKELLAGLILKLGSLEIDGSLLNRFREATDEIKKAASV